MVLWTNSATRYRIMGVEIAWSRGRHHIFEIPKMWQSGMLCRRQSGTRSSSLLEKKEDELVWIQRRKGAKWCISKRLEKYSKREESGAAQRDKGTAKRYIVRRTGKHSKKGG